ncbi:MAG: hypothetical protein AABZ64_00845 [Nitrospinota bacterium]
MAAIWLFQPGAAQAAPCTITVKATNSHTFAVYIHHDQTKFLANYAGAQWRPMALFHPAGGDRTSVRAPLNSNFVDAVDGCNVPKRYVFRLGWGDTTHRYRYFYYHFPGGGRFTNATTIDLGNLYRFFAPPAQQQQAPSGVVPKMKPINWRASAVLPPLIGS